MGSAILILLFCVIRLQVRYRQNWAPVHPKRPISGILTEMLLTPGEVFAHFKTYSGGVIDAMEFASNLRNFTRAGTHAGELTTFVPLNELLYFSGNGRSFFGGVVTRIMPHRKTCNAP